MSNTTTVVGYFNPNEYPMQVVISEHNLTLHLKPKDWIFDRNGQQVNDPLLDKYVGKGRLARAIGTTQRPINFLVGVNRQPPLGQPQPQYRHAVSQAAGFYRDQSGQVRPIPQTEATPVAVLPPPVSYNPVKAMTVEQARKLKFIKPTRPVSEDDGLKDTTGIPPAGDRVPVINYALDTTKATPKPLPNEVLAQPLSEDQQAAVKSAIVGNLAEAAQPNIDETPDAVALAIAQAKKEQANPQQPPPLVVPPPLPSSAPLLEQTKKVALTVPPIPLNPQPTLMTPTELPEPVLDEVVVDTELPATAPAVPLKAAVPPPPTDEEPTAIMSPPAPTAERLACPACGTKLVTPGYLKRHINRKHPDQAPALLARLGMS